MFLVTRRLSFDINICQGFFQDTHEEVLFKTARRRTVGPSRIKENVWIFSQLKSEWLFPEEYVKSLGISTSSQSYFCC